MDKKDIMDRLDKLMVDKGNKEAIQTVVGYSNVMGYIEASNDFGKGMIAGGCILLLTSWVGKKFL